jgi:hypothetical protein
MSRALPPMNWERQSADTEGTIESLVGLVRRVGEPTVVVREVSAWEQRF